MFSRYSETLMSPVQATLFVAATSIVSRGLLSKRESLTSQIMSAETGNLGGLKIQCTGRAKLFLQNIFNLNLEYIRTGVSESSLRGGKNA